MTSYLYLLTPTVIVARISLFRADSRFVIAGVAGVANAERLLQGKCSATANGCGDFRTDYRFAGEVNVCDEAIE